MKNVFIIGISRTGSKFYLQLLNSHPDIYVAPEMCLRKPFRSDLYSLLRRHILFNHDYANIVDAILSCNIKDTLAETLETISRDELIFLLEKRNTQNIYDIFESILYLAATNRGKSISGAKFPVHYKYLDELIANFPQSKIIFLTRDPREIYISHSAKRTKNKVGMRGTHGFGKAFIDVSSLCYALMEWTLSINRFDSIQKRIGKDRIRLFPYENILSDKNQVIHEVWRFLNVLPGHNGRGQLELRDSSFGKLPELNRWREKLNRKERFVFSFLIGSKMAKYGYYEV